MATCLPPQLWLMLQMCQSYRKNRVPWLTDLFKFKGRADNEYCMMLHVHYLCMTEKPTCTPSHLSQKFPQYRLWNSSNVPLIDDGLSVKIVEHFLSPPFSHWCDVLGFEPKGTDTSYSGFPILPLTFCSMLTESVKMVTITLGSLHQQYPIMEVWKQSS